MKTAKKSLALLLALLMCLSLFSTMAFAEDAKNVKLVCIGDSTSNGFGLNDYGKLSGTTWAGTDDDCYGFLDYASKESYPYVLAQHLTDKGYAVDVKNLSLEGMRTDELRGILDTEWGATVPATKGEAGDGHYERHMQWYNSFFSKNADALGTNSISEFFTDAIKAADVITLDLTMNNFGVYLSNRFLAMTGGKGECGDFSKYSETVDDIADELDIDVASIENTVKELLAKMLPADAGIPTELVDKLIDTLVYCYCDFRVNFQADVELIQALNPDAKLIVVGAYNFMNGLQSTFNGIDVDFGSLWGTVTALVNTFLTNTCKGADKYYYADCSKGLEMYIDNIAMAEKPEDIYRNFTNRLLQDAMGNGNLTYEIAVGMAGKESVDGMLNGFIKAAAYTPLDVGGVFGLFGSGKDLDELGANALSDWDNASPAEKSIAHVYVRFMAGHGLGAHPDAVGCEQKADAVIAAYEKTNTAKTDGSDAINDIGKNVFNTVWGALKAPIFDAIKNAFNKFADTIQNILNTIFQPVFSIFDKIPSC